MSIKATYAKISLAALSMAALAAEASAMGHLPRNGNSVPEIDGPAGVAAIALLVSAGIMAYHRLRK